ncbi:MAG: AbrB/MazE/SpoVT family DNA-binding domain-containing protein [SAR324 cluster bacterium]|nr:AbrB/MazE/SpoVT family DNA-binding domain-containing protein [SAR324 cluster bacterium]
MTEAVLSLKYWGNNLGVRLPVAVATKARLHADQQVRLSVEEGRVVLTPLQEEPSDLEKRLARFDPERHRGEVMASDRQGAERW